MYKKWGENGKVRFHIITREIIVEEIVIKTKVDEEENLYLAVLGCDPKLMQIIGIKMFCYKILSLFFALHLTSLKD